MDFITYNLKKIVNTLNHNFFKILKSHRFLQYINIIQHNVIVIFFRSISVNVQRMERKCSFSVIITKKKKNPFIIEPVHRLVFTFFLSIEFFFYVNENGLEVCPFVYRIDPIFCIVKWSTLQQCSNNMLGSNKKLVLPPSFFFFLS